MTDSWEVTEKITRLTEKHLPVSKAGLLNKFFAIVFETDGVEPLPDFPDREFDEAITTVDISENIF